MRTGTLYDWVSSLPWPPVAPLMGYPGIQINRTTVKQNLFNWGIQFWTVYELAEKLQPDMSFVLMDLSVEASALGAAVRYPLHEIPTVEEPLVRQREDLLQFQALDILKDGRVHVFLETIRLLKKSVDIPVCGYVIGPFSLTGLLMGASEAAMATITDPDFLGEVLAFSTRTILHYARAQVEAGADVVAILEPTAALLSAASFDTFSAPYVAEIVRATAVPCILHICGDASRLVPAMAGTGAQGLSLDYQVDLAAAAEQVPDDVVLIGNLDPAGVLSRGTPDEVAAATEKLLREMEGRKNFLLSSGCDLPPETPLENIRTMIETARAFSRA